MALDATWATGSAVTKATAKTFIPAIWSDEIIAAYEKSIVMKPLVKSIKMSGKKGDTIHVPMPTRSDANSKVAEKQVTLIANTEGEKVITIDQHWEFSKLIEDIVEKQALSSLRSFYTQDAGYALGRKVDSDLIAGENADVVLAHLSRYVCSDNVPIFQLNAEHGIWKRVDDLAFHFDLIFLRHWQASSLN